MNILKFTDLLKEFKPITYNKNQMIREEGELCDEIGIVTQGLVKISTFTTSEKEETITLLNEGDVFGNNLVFSSNPYYLGSVISIKKSEIIFIKKKKLMELFSTNQLFLEDFLNDVCNNAIHIKQQNKLLAHKSTEDRIMYYLITLSKQQKSKEITIPKITELSLILSIPRPSISRELKILEEKGYIKRDLHKVIIKMD